MKFNVSGKTFQTQLQAVSKVINAKNALSILDNFLLRVEGDRLSITGSDQENVMTAYMEITESECDGQIAVPAKRLLEVIKEIASQPLTFDINDSTKEVDIRFLNGHFNFMGVDAAEYPLSRKPDEDARTMIFPATVASGWFTAEKSDFDSQHIYFKRLIVPSKMQLPVLVSECGGYSRRVQEHFYAKYAQFGYGDCADEQELTEQIQNLYVNTILPAVSKGVCGCVYTQLSDVEDEINGLYTYDRKVCKVNRAAMLEIREKLDQAVSQDSNPFVN